MIGEKKNKYMYIFRQENKKKGKFYNSILVKYVMMVKNKYKYRFQYKIRRKKFKNGKGRGNN